MGVGLGRRKAAARAASYGSLGARAEEARDSRVSEAADLLLASIHLSPVGTSLPSTAIR